MTEQPSEPTTPEPEPTPPPDQPPPRPPSNGGWAAASVIFFWPLAFMAFTHALNVYPLWATGDYAGAKQASDQTKFLGKLSLGIALVLVALFLIAYAVLATVALHYGHDMRQYHHMHNRWR